MTHFLDTSIRHFRFNAMHQDKFVAVRFYKLVEEDKELTISCLTSEEVHKLIDYLVPNTINFGPKNRHDCTQNSILIISTDENDFNESFPHFIILKKNPIVRNNPRRIMRCMEIELLDDKGKSLHSYPLNFEVIGELTGRL
jgi:hypothetical protein